MHLNVCLTIENFVLVGLDWVSTHDAIFFSMSHIHAYVLFHSYFWIVIVICFSLSLSLSDRLHMAPKCKSTPTQNPLGSGGLLFLLIPFPLFMFGSMMGRLSRTSLRTFRNVAFIRSAMSFCWTFPTFLYPVSFGLGDGNFFVRYP